MESQAAKLPSDPSYYQPFHSSQRVVSKAITDTVSARCDGT